VSGVVSVAITSVVAAGFFVVLTGVVAGLVVDTGEVVDVGVVSRVDAGVPVVGVFVVLSDVTAGVVVDAVVVLGVL